MISYDARTGTIKALGANIPGAGPVSVGEISFGKEKVRDASEMAEALDDYQVLMCEIEKNLNDEAERKKYRMLRVATVGLLTSARATLAAFKADTKGQEQNLDDIIDRLRNFSVLIGRSALSDFGVDKAQIEAYLKKGSVPTLEADVIPEALELAQISTDEAEEIEH